MCKCVCELGIGVFQMTYLHTNSRSNFTKGRRGKEGRKKKGNMVSVKACVRVRVSVCMCVSSEGKHWEGGCLSFSGAEGLSI